MSSDKKYTQQEIIQAYYQDLYQTTEAVPESIIKTCNNHYNDFIKLFKLDSVHTNKKPWEGYKFSEESKSFLVWLFQNYTTSNLKKIRKGQIDFDNLADYRRMYFGAEQMAQDFDVSKEELEQLRGTVYKIGNYPRIVCNSFSKCMEKMILDSTDTISDADRMVCLEWIYTKVLRCIEDVVDEMEDIRRNDMLEAIQKFGQWDSDNITLLQQDAWITAQLEKDSEYQNLLQKMREIESPKSTKGSRQITTQRKETAKIQEKLKNIEAQYRQDCGYLAEVEEQEDLHIEEICRSMTSSEECLSQALEKVKQNNTEIIELMD